MMMMSHATNACRSGWSSLAKKLMGHFDCNQISKAKSTFTGDHAPGFHLWWKMKREVHTELNIVRTFTQQDVSAFITLTGDENPIHRRKASDSDGAQQPSVVPGILLASLFPSLIGTHYPGSLYLNQTLKFRNQVLVGDTVKAKVLLQRKSGQRAKFLTTCHVISITKGNYDEERLAVEGTALALLGELH